MALYVHFCALSHYHRQLVEVENAHHYDKVAFLVMVGKLRCEYQLGVADNCTASPQERIKARLHSPKQQLRSAKSAAVGQSDLKQHNSAPSSSCHYCLDTITRHRVLHLRLVAKR